MNAASVGGRCRFGTSSSGWIPFSQPPSVASMSGEPNYLTLRDLAYWRSRSTHRSPPGPRPTLGDLQRSTPWLWMCCERCRHRAPLACAVAVIRWGAEQSSDTLRRCARCTACGHKGACLQHPSWTNTQIGFQPFPMS
jgi:hypothetical protein